MTVPDAPEQRTDRRPMLLVVDDNEANRELFCRRLATRSLAATAAASGQEALAALSAGRFDLVLLDIMMPGMSGFAVLDRIRERWAPIELPVIMVTALDSSADLVEALSRGANDYVVKPVDIEVAVARIRTHLALKEATDEVRRLNEYLTVAQERIAQLAASGPEAFRDFGRWARSMADELADTLAADAAGVFLLEEEALVPVAGGRASVPPLSEARASLRGKGPIEGESGTVAAIASPRGDLLGAVSVEGGPRPRGDLDLRLLGSLAAQLGGALEMRRLRQEAAAASRQRRPAERVTERLWICPACGRCLGVAARTCPDDGTALLDPREVPRRLLDRYELRRLLGEGGMGTVFEARDERLGRDVAVKIIKPEHLHNASMRQRLEREARAIAKIDHPGVVALFDSGELGDGSLFLVMERLQGWDLADLFRMCGPGTPWQVGQLLRQGAAALGAAHRIGIIHRDIKPDNVFLVDAPEGLRAKLVDFGLAMEMGRDVRLTRSGLIVGTPAFMAPEQIAGRDVDERVDVYCFAAVAYQALVGRGVTLETELDRVFVDILKIAPPRVSELFPGVPPEVDEAFATALAKSPDERPRDVEAWAASFVVLLEELAPRSAGWVFPPPGAGSGGPRARTLPRAMSGG